MLALCADVLFTFDEIIGKTIKLTSVQPNQNLINKKWSGLACWLHFCEFPDVTIGVNSSIDFNRIVHCFIKPIVVANHTLQI